MLESLHNGALIIEVHMKLVDPTKPPARFIPENPFACGAILGMFMDQDSADIVIEVKGKHFHAHRFVVQKCSTILADADLPIQLTNVSPDIFHHLMYYMYGGEIADNEMKLHAKEIINAADVYGVVNLKLDAETLSFEHAPKTFVKDLLITCASGEGNSNNKLDRMPVNELRRDCHLKRLDFQGSREVLIAALKKKQRTS